jgi:hypothetical protein
MSQESDDSPWKWKQSTDTYDYTIRVHPGIRMSRGFSKALDGMLFYTNACNPVIALPRMRPVSH